jgi:hypothetical protein
MPPARLRVASSTRGSRLDLTSAFQAACIIAASRMRSVIPRLKRGSSEEHGDGRRESGPFPEAGARPPTLFQMRRE